MNYIEFKTKFPNRTPFIIKLKKEHMGNTIYFYESAYGFIENIKTFFPKLNVYTREQADLLANTYSMRTKSSYWKITLNEKNFPEIKEFINPKIEGTVELGSNLNKRVIGNVTGNVIVNVNSNANNIAITNKVNEKPIKLFFNEKKQSVTIKYNENKFISTKFTETDMEFDIYVSLYIAMLKNKNIKHDEIETMIKVNQENLRNFTEGMVYGLYKESFNNYEHFINWSDRLISKKINQ